MSTNGYGRQDGVSARTGLWIVLGLLIATAVLLSMGWERAAARAADQGIWCERTGPHESGMAMFSTDGGETWQKP